ncbi:peptidylprolyl isomerase [Sphingomonas sinipercae]|uniref:peptidylprolyl isomerase n=1 Tax=Sphingomonas sinipercae TaxID=2714944 RepID=UPI003CCE423C
MKLPENPQLYGTTLPSVVKATAIVNGAVITQTDIDQRVALLAAASGKPIPKEQMPELRQQVLGNLIDEVLQIQAAKAEKITVTEKDIDRAIARLAQANKQSQEQLSKYLESNGSSLKAVRRQFEGELAWEKLLRAKIEDTIHVGDDEVKSVIDRMNASKGARQYKVSEIYLSAPGGDIAQATARATQILEQLAKGASFPAYARQYSEASTAAVGGDLGWVRPEQLPESMAAVLQQMSPGSISRPIPVPGGVSIVGLEDVRNFLAPDPRNAVLTLKQLTIKLPGSSGAETEAALRRFAAAAQNIGGCGGAEKIANEFSGEIVESDSTKLRDLPPALQEMMMQMQVGQATRPFIGNDDGSARILVLCGREVPQEGTPTKDQIYAQLNEQRVNSRARRYLRDLRRDAVIEFR